MSLVGFNFNSICLIFLFLFPSLFPLKSYSSNLLCLLSKLGHNLFSRTATTKGFRQVQNLRKGTVCNNAKNNLLMGKLTKKEYLLLLFVPKITWNILKQRINVNIVWNTLPYDPMVLNLTDWAFNTMPMMMLFQDSI